MRILGQIVVGLLILTIAFVLLGVVQFPVLMLAFVAPAIGGLMNFVWFAVIIGLVIYGMARSKPGLALSPIVFIALWVGAAVVGQWRLQNSIDPKVWDRPISPEASAQRTLIVESPLTVDNKVVADGLVDRLIRLRLDSSNQKISRIEEVSLARGDACSAEEKQASQQLQNEGRSDECFKWRSLVKIPDGLVIEQFYRIGVNNGGFGCCNETQARLRTGGQERPLFSWYQGQAYVLSYFPLFGFFAPSARPWEIGSGIVHPVRYGLDEIDTPKMISAIYGVTPPYASDRGGPVPLVTLSASETLDQAQTFAKLANVSPKSITALLIAARDKGIVDQRSIDAATSLVGRDNEGWTAVTDFAKGLTNDQTALLIEKVVQRLETLGICDECIASQSVANPSLRDWKLSERLPDPQALLDRAIRIFVERHDLATWQYEGCLRIITSLGPQGHPASRNYMYQSVRPLIFVDDTPAYSDKAIAMLRGTHERPSSEVVRLAAKFDLVRDRDLKEYMTRIWSGELTSLPQRNASPETYAIATKACERIARILDPVLRAEKFGVDCPVPQSPQSGRAPR